MPIVDGIDVDLAHFDPTDPKLVSEILPLVPDPQRQLFSVSEEGYSPGSRHYFRVTFHRRNFSAQTRRLHTPSELVAGDVTSVLSSQDTCLGFRLG